MSLAVVAVDEVLNHGARFPNQNVIVIGVLHGGDAAIWTDLGGKGGLWSENSKYQH